MTKPRAFLLSLALGVIAGAARAALMLKDIPVRAGEETAALARMWPAWLWGVSLFVLSVRALWPDAGRETRVGP